MKGTNRDLPRTIDEYEALWSEDVISVLKQMRLIIAETCPDAQEVISYGMPAFKTQKVLVYYAANKHHLGFYPTPKPIIKYENELQSFKYSKGAVQFPYDKPLPADLIKKMVLYRMSTL